MRDVSLSGLRDARVLLTGATGFLGAAVARSLLAVGARVSIFTRETADFSRLRDVLEQLDRQDGDLRTFSTVRRAVDKSAPDFVAHLAAAGVTDPLLPVEAALRNNLHGTLNLLKAVAGRSKIVVARTPGELSAMNVYAASKAAAWQFAQLYARTEGLPVLGLMPFQCYGSGQPERQ